MHRSRQFLAGSRLKHVDEPLSANDIQAGERGVIKQIIRVAHRVGRSHDLTRLRVVYQHLRWSPASDEQPVTCFIQGHRIVG